MTYNPALDPRARTSLSDFRVGDLVRMHRGTVPLGIGRVEGLEDDALLVARTGYCRGLRIQPAAFPTLLLERDGVPPGLELVDDYTRLVAGDLIYRDGQDWLVSGPWRWSGLPCVRPSNDREAHYLQHDVTTWLVSRTPAQPLIVKGPAEQIDRIRIENPTVKVKAPAALLDALVVAYEQLMTANAVLEGLHERITGEGEVAEDDSVVPASVQQLARRVAELAGAASAWATQLDGAVGHDDVHGALASDRVQDAHEAVYAADDGWGPARE